MEEKTEIIIDEQILKDKVYLIRGVQVMLDSDLAEIYGYTTKRLNEQVKNNIEKFDEDFMFQLSEDEVKELSRSKNMLLNNDFLRSKFLTSKQDDSNLKSKFLTSSLNHLALKSKNLTLKAL